MLKVISNEHQRIYVQIEFRVEIYSFLAQTVKQSRPSHRPHISDL